MTLEKCNVSNHNYVDNRPVNPIACGRLVAGARLQERGYLQTKIHYKEDLYVNNVDYWPREPGSYSRTKPLHIPADPKWAAQLADTCDGCWELWLLFSNLDP